LDQARKLILLYASLLYADLSMVFIHRRPLGCSTMLFLLVIAFSEAVPLIRNDREITVNSLGDVTTQQQTSLVQLTTLDDPFSNYSAAYLEYSKLSTTSEKVVYLHNAFRCLHGSPPVAWDEDLESDMKSAISGTSWTMEKGISGLPNKTGMVAVNLFWNAGEAAPTPEESVSSWYAECDTCSGGCSGFADGCPASPSRPTTHFQNVVRSDVEKVACANSADQKTLACFYSIGGSSRTLDVSPRVKRAEDCNAVAALSFTKKLLCVTSSMPGQQDAVTLQMRKCSGEQAQSLLIRGGSLEFKSPGGTCVTVGQEKKEEQDGCHMVTLATCNEDSKYQQWRTWKVDAYGDNEQELWKNPETNTTLGIRNRQIWSCSEASKVPFLRLGRLHNSQPA